MSFKNIIENKAGSAQYMVDNITTIIKTCGKRDPGSEGEKQSVDYMAKQLNSLADEVKVEPFDVYPASFMSWIYITVTLALIAVVLSFFCPIISIMLIAVGVILMIGQFVLYRQIIDKLFKKKTSYNITAVKHPKGEVKRRIFLNGHPDAAWEWTVNYHMGGVAFVAHFVISVVGLLYYVALSIATMIVEGVKFGLIMNPTIRILAYVGLIFVPFWIGMYFLWNERIVVDGANDNLTGCYMGIAFLKAMQDSGLELENTEVGVLISGSEEAGLRGAKAWVKAHKDEYKDCETIIYAFDTIRERKFLCVNKLDLNNTVKADAHGSALFLQAAENLGVHCIVGSVPLGATDSAAFNQGGFHAVGITALDHNLRDYYHTRRDTYDNLDAECLADTFAVTVETVRLFDEGK